MYKVYPMHIIIDPEGKISYKRKNALKNIEAKLVKRIDLLLGHNYKKELPKSTEVYTFNKNTAEDPNL